MRIMIIVPVIWLLVGALTTAINTTEGSDTFSNIASAGDEGTPFVESFDNISDFTNLSLQNPTVNDTSTLASGVTETGTWSYIRAFIENTFKVIGLKMNLGDAPVVVEFMVDLFFGILNIAWIVDFVHFLRGVS